MVGGMTSVQGIIIMHNLEFNGAIVTNERRKWAILLILFYFLNHSTCDLACN